MALKDDLTEVRYFTADDIYFYLTDNRPLGDLAGRDEQIADLITARNSISEVPLYVGQTAVVGRVGFMAVGTASVDDWIQITE